MHTDHNYEQMRTFAALIIIATALTACHKDPPIPQPKSVCGTAGWRQGTWKVKFALSGTTRPDSANFNINMGQRQFGSPAYNRWFTGPVLPLTDSVNFCGDWKSDIILQVYDTDTTHIYTGSIYVNDTVVWQQTGHAYLFLVGQCE